MKQVSIVYCKPCGYLKRAEAAAGAVKEKFGVSVSLTPGTGGIFEVRIGANGRSREKGTSLTHRRSSRPWRAP